jgi:hypothetical protein
VPAISIAGLSAASMKFRCHFPEHAIFMNNQVQKYSRQSPGASPGSESMATGCQERAGTGRLWRPSVLAEAWPSVRGGNALNPEENGEEQDYRSTAQEEMILFLDEGRAQMNWVAHHRTGFVLDCMRLRPSPIWYFTAPRDLRSIVRNHNEPTRRPASI